MFQILLALGFVVSASAQKPPKNYPEDVFQNGHIMLDVLEDTAFSSEGRKILALEKAGQPVPLKLQQHQDEVVRVLMSPQDKELLKEVSRNLGYLEGTTIPQWKPNFNFLNQEKFKKDLAANPKVGDHLPDPWIYDKHGKNLSYDIRDPKDAEMVVNILQRYVLEGWFNNDKTAGKKQYDQHFRENTDRTWCNTPWLNVTEKGREALHGLTKEFPIRDTTVYPSIPAEITKSEGAVTWGIAYFNQKVCEQYADFYSDKEEKMAQQLLDRKPELKALDGAVSFKLLFNAMPEWRKEMKGVWTVTNDKGEDALDAYNWYAHVSYRRNDDRVKNGDESIRQVMNVAHVQMDIALRDSRLKGTRDDLQNWVMTTYYFDAHYTNPYLADMDIPQALKHMRPVGIQYGLDAGESIIFAGAKNNHRPGPNFGGTGEELPFENTRLNGPVDNIEGSCLGCHAGAGMNFALPAGRRAPLSFLTNESYFQMLNETGGYSYDFNMQLDKSMRNFSKVMRELRKNDKFKVLEEAPK